MAESIEMLEIGEVREEAGFSNIVIGNTAPLPADRKYKSPRLGGLHLPYFAPPKGQLLLVAFICFLLPGSYNALSGLGGGGQVDSRAFDLAQMALYSTFAVCAFFSSTIVNHLGVRWPLVAGSSGYVLFVIAQLCYKHTCNGDFVIVSGIILGGSAALLWAAQGVTMVSSPTEDQKGR